MRSEKIRKGMAAMAIGAMLSAQMAAPIAWAKSNGSGGGDPQTATPIKHVIVLIGEPHFRPYVRYLSTEEW
jgi:hypothetical protein